jgi:hypothetical protein
MAQGFKQDADALRSWLDIKERTRKADVEKVAKILHRSIDVLYKLDKLRRDLDSANPEDEEASDRLALEIVTLLNLRCRI